MLVFCGMDIFISQQLQKSDSCYGEYEVWNDIYDGNINADLLIYGSSRAYRHFDPNIIEDSLDLSAYNLGINGHNFWLQYLRHIEYIKTNTLPKHILLAVDVNSLGKIKDLFQMDQFLPYMLWNKNITKFTSSYEGYNRLDYYVPALRYFGKSNAKQEALVALMSDSIIPYRKKGYNGSNEKWNDDFINAKKKMTYYEVRIDKPSLDLFDKFLKECQNNNIKITLVHSPLYIEGQEFVKNRKEILQIFKDFALKYNLYFLDYSKDALSFDKNNFYNAMHLNRLGAELFTKKLVGDLKNINNGS